jgi:hypothetical protein
VVVENEVLWTLPVPSSSLTRGPTLSVLARRSCEIAYFVEADDSDRRSSIVFEGVEAFKCTYMTALSIDMINLAYDKLVRIKPSSWLADVVKVSDSYYRNRGQSERAPLQHLMICFDDGPCYEFICREFRMT